MKIQSITRDGNIFTINFTPNWFEKLFGVKPKAKQYKSTGSTYVVGGGNVYMDRKGNQLGPFNRIGITLDKHRNSW